MIPKFRAWLPTLKWMCNVSAILFDENSLDVYKMGDTERVTEMSVSQDEIIFMQSTGLFDKNGKAIFEGDIIDTTDYEGGLSSVGNPLVKVERDKYGFVVTGDFPTSPITLKEFEAGRKFAGVEVIIAGNIYENPELVEVIDD
ncbi:YopX family protein [Streptococcus anginosus]|uniref:YopX family protein n=1 Tax=Streptococcus anginosus TaxID=1328 RepID=UPI00300FD8E5